MGAWGTGLYDNDEALDVIAAVIRGIPRRTDPVRRTTLAALRMWLLEDDPDLWARDIGDVGTLPPALRDRLKEWSRPKEDRTMSEIDRVLALRHRSWEPDGSRNAEAKRILGEYSDGPRVDALLAREGADVVIHELVDRCCQRLDKALAIKPGSAQRDLYRLPGSLALLGILLELRQARLISSLPDEQIARWERGIALASEHTDDEREFWDEYLRNVRAALQVLR
jgi:hypothetical protein